MVTFLAVNALLHCNNLLQYQTHSFHSFIRNEAPITRFYNGEYYNIVTVHEENPLKNDRERNPLDLGGSWFFLLVHIPLYSRSSSLQNWAQNVVCPSIYGTFLIYAHFGYESVWYQRILFVILAV